MNLRGRKKIIVDASREDLVDKQKLANLINFAMLKHGENKSEIDFLIDYKKGRQAILNKQKPIREEINNKVVINHAQMITRNIIGYFLGTPIQYIQNGNTDKKHLIDELNRVVQYEDKASVDKEIGEYQSICGTAYRIIFQDGVFEDEIPFEDRALNPSTTFVVYENSVAERPLFGGTYYDLYNDEDNFVGKKIYIYTDFGLFTVITDDNGQVHPEGISEVQEYNVGGVPIIEYPNNMWRIGDWELCIGLMDAINNLQSGRLDDIDQIVQSLLVFINAEIDGETYDEMREKGAVMLTNTTGNQSNVKSVENSLDQSGMNLFATEMEDLLYAMIGIPSRNNRGGGGGDTGQAVELRDGWADLEIIARNKELSYKKSEKQALKIILSMFNIGKSEQLSLMDVEIKFSRNKNNNLLVKTQSYQTLIGTKTLSPADCLNIVDLVSDANDYIDRGKLFWGEDFGNPIPKKEINVDGNVSEDVEILEN